jgi:hypothetical protein
MFRSHTAYIQPGQHTSTIIIPAKGPMKTVYPLRNERNPAALASGTKTKRKHVRAK